MDNRKNISESTSLPIALTFDVEDWYMGLELPLDEWEGKEGRLEVGLKKILDLLKEFDRKATFFILGSVAEKYPDEVREIATDGHEIGSHGYSHTMVYKLTPDEFRDEVRRTDKLLTDITGQRPRGFRAPYYSITKKSLWALDILVDEGYKYDSSIYPGYNYRYGIVDSPTETYIHPGRNIIEFPGSMMELFGKKIGIGGAYLRILPLFLTIRGIRERLKDGKDTMLYLHPWEFDPKHPKIKVAPLATMTHYFRLKGTYSKLKKILMEFPTTTMGEMVDNFDG